MNRILTWCIALLFLSCSTNSGEGSNESSTSSDSANTDEVSDEVQSQNVQEEAPKFTVIVSDSKEELKKYYEIDFIKGFYEYDKEMQYTAPRDLEFPEDLSKLSYGDLRLLRNEVFARNGYLFSDGFLRGYFNRFDWYMPIFDVDTFKVVMSQEEQDLVNQIIREEAKRKEEMFVVRDEDLELYNADLIANVKQFKSIDRKIINDLSKNNFSIVQANRQMPFYTYDKNAYQYIPHYITTDLYLFILHKYFSSFLEKLDQKYMSVILNSILSNVLGEVESLRSQGSSASSLTWVESYCKVALFAGSLEEVQVSPEIADIYVSEVDAIKSESGNPTLIPNPYVDYKELKPRGHYTKTDELKGYFRTFKWISLNGIDLKNDDQLKGLLSLAYIIKSNNIIRDEYEAYVSIIERLAGQEDNVSIRDVITSIDDIDTHEEVLSNSTLSKVRRDLSSLNKERIKKVFGNDFATPEKEVDRVYFLSSTYSISGEIFSKLVHVNGSESMRPFPKGLDIPAVFGNQTAENILVYKSQDTNKWPEFQPKLKELQDQFSGYEGWKANYGSFGLKTALAASGQRDNYPNFMKTYAYDRKELSTMLSSWTHIKHDLILYQEKPYAAEAGQGGGPEPPKHYSFVEPNLEFWDQALELANWLKGFHRYNDTFSDELERIIGIGLNLQKAAKMHLRNESLPDDLLRELSWIGARIEYILLGLLETDHLPEREKSMALIADVYSYNGTNLNVAVGHADDIYVIVPIKGEYHIARGSIFSYYEFTDDKIYTDEEWRGMQKTRSSLGNLPERPEWIAPLINAVPNPEGQMEFRYAGHWWRDN